MSNLFTMLDFAVADSSLPVLSPSDYEPLVNYEVDSYGHWVFGGGSDSLLDLKSQKALTLASATPTYGGAYVLLGGGLNTGLVSDLADGTERTFCAVVEIPDLTTLAGSSVIGNVNDTDGMSMFVAKTAGVIGLLPIVRGATGLTASSNATLAAGNYIFIAMSWTQTGSNKIIKFIGGKVNAKQTSTTAHTVAARNIAFGNVSYTNTSYHAPIKIAEGILYDKALTAEQMQAVYERAKARQLERGITVI